MGWIGCDLIEAVLFMHSTACNNYALTPMRSRMSPSVEAALWSGKLLM
jgi:hypothetical protein